MSQSGTNPFGSLANSFTSLAILTSGQCFASILRDQGSISQNKTGWDNSAQLKPRAKPPIPEHKSTCLSIMFSVGGGWLYGTRATQTSLTPSMDAVSSIHCQTI